jgi:hypothetical protein
VKRRDLPMPAEAAIVEMSFGKVLKTLDKLGREPEPWEQAALVEALCSMSRRQYAQAARRILDVARSVRHQSATGTGGVKVTRQVLRHALMHIQTARTSSEGGAPLMH